MQSIILPFDFGMDIQAYVNYLSKNSLYASEVAKEVAREGSRQDKNHTATRRTTYLLISPASLGFKGNVSRLTFFREIQRRYKKIHRCTIKQALLFYSMTKKTSLMGIMDRIIYNKKFVISIQPVVYLDNKHYALSVFKDGQQMWLRGYDFTASAVLPQEQWVFVRN